MGRPDEWMVKMTAITVSSIGVVRGGRSERVEDHWDEVVSTIVFDPGEVGHDATQGLDDFSHLEVVFFFHLEDRVRRFAEHPRGNRAWPKVGVLAHHGPVRPNHLGVSRCRLLKTDGLELTVQGLDALDGTPILDIKPYSRHFDPRGEIDEPAWMDELMSEYY